MQPSIFLSRCTAAGSFGKMRLILGGNRLLHGLTEAGDPIVNPDDSSPILEQSHTRSPAVRILILNRPKALHALNTHMVSAIYNRLRSIELSDEIKCVVICSKGAKHRALCAGGDVRSLYFTGKEKNFDGADQFFRTEYSMNSLIASLEQTTVVSILDGIVMGGGVGLVMYGKYRIATENTVLAMPECAIGLHPDIGASFFLSRLPSGYGMYMGLTGAKLKGMDVVAAGFGTHFVQSESIEQVLDLLQSAKAPDDSFVSTMLSCFEKKIPPSSTLPGARVVQEAFTLGSVEQIEERLHSIASSGLESDSKFAASALESLHSGCPTSLKIAFESITRGRLLGLDDCLKSEFRVTSRCVRRHDFYAGVDSVLISKDRNPIWEPSNLSSVRLNDIERFFEPLEKDVKIPELDLDHWKLPLKNTSVRARM